MVPAGSMSSSQDPATGPYPEPDESSPHPPTLFSPMYRLILSSGLRPGLKGNHFPSGFPAKIP
jgi:hypothetical protein